MAGLGCVAAVLECAVCMERYTDPRVLSCGHTFCLQCLQRMDDNIGSLPCPSCRTMSLIPSEGLAYLPKPYALLRVLEAVEECSVTSVREIDPPTPYPGPPDDSATEVIRENADFTDEHGMDMTAGDTRSSDTPPPSYPGFMLFQSSSRHRARSCINPQDPLIESAQDSHQAQLIDARNRSSWHGSSSERGLSTYHSHSLNPSPTPHSPVDSLQSPTRFPFYSPTLRNRTGTYDLYNNLLPSVTPVDKSQVYSYCTAPSAPPLRLTVYSGPSKLYTDSPLPSVLPLPNPTEYVPPRSCDTAYSNSKQVSICCCNYYGT